MIINIRGTSGSGKSTVMRRVMDLMGDWQAVHKTGRKQPLYYRSASEWPPTVVLGHYESPCGGCDTIGSARAVFELIQNLRTDPLFDSHVLCEGLLLSEDVKWFSQLPDLKVLFLVTPLDVCLQQIKKRRREAGNEKALNPSNTTNRIAVIERARVKLIGSGIDCRRCSANQAPKMVINMLRLHAQREDRNGRADLAYREGR